MRIAASVLLLSAAAFSGCATTGSLMIKPTDKVAVIAHRGASAYAPENTLAAFELAVDMKADWYELDCLLAKDDTVIVSHDNDVDRCTDGKGLITEKTLAELKALDAGTWYDPKFAGERLPTLAESLAMAKDRIGVYVEIKSVADDGPVMEQLRVAAEGHDVLNPQAKAGLVEVARTSGNRNVALARAAIADIRAAGMEKQVVIQSFSPIVCLVAVTEAPEIRTEYLGSYKEEKPEAWNDFITWGTRINVAGFNVSQPSLTEERLKEFHDLGKTVAVWTVDDPESMKQLIGWGVDAIITNKPDVLRAVLAGG
jgi:glycerophosphoryl diester phosphodiesterase